ncbi:hypothetical protein KIPB_008052, partial [Kipferlia bialata]
QYVSTLPPLPFPEFVYGSFIRRAFGDRQKAETEIISFLIGLRAYTSGGDAYYKDAFLTLFVDLLSQKLYDPSDIDFACHTYGVLLSISEGIELKHPSVDAFRAETCINRIFQNDPAYCRSVLGSILSAAVPLTGQESLLSLGHADCDSHKKVDVGILLKTIVLQRKALVHMHNQVLGDRLLAIVAEETNTHTQGGDDKDTPQTSRPSKKGKDKKGKGGKTSRGKKADKDPSTILSRGLTEPVELRHLARLFASLMPSMTPCAEYLFDSYVQAMIAAKATPTLAQVLKLIQSASHQHTMAYDVSTRYNPYETIIDPYLALESPLTKEDLMAMCSEACVLVDRLCGVALVIASGTTVDNRLLHTIPNMVPSARGSRPATRALDTAQGTRPSRRVDAVYTRGGTAKCKRRQNRVLFMNVFHLMHLRDGLVSCLPPSLHSKAKTPSVADTPLAPETAARGTHMLIQTLRFCDK